MAINNIYPQLAGHAYKKYRKVVPHPIGGKRLDPFKVNENIFVDWLLKTEEVDFDFEAKKIARFAYENEVIELYSEVEDKVFRRLNPGMFEQGFLAVYGENQPELKDKTHYDLDTIASIRLPSNFKKAVQELPKTALSELEKKIREKNRPISFLAIIEACK